LFKLLSTISGAEFGQGQIYFAGKIQVVFDEASNCTQNINSSLYPVTRGCEPPTGTIVSRVQIVGALCPFAGEEPDYLVPQKNTPLG
jgi:hypothetical protein